MHDHMSVHLQADFSQGKLQQTSEKRTHLFAICRHANASEVGWPLLMLSSAIFSFGSTCR